MASVLHIPQFQPRWYQWDLMRFFDRGGTRACEVWPRRSGKDMAMVHQAAKAMLKRTGLYLHTLPSHKQARKVVWDNIDNDGKSLLKEAFPDELVASRNNTEMKITLHTGSIWQLVGADYFDSLVGANPVGLTMSEAALTDPNAWAYLRPILAANGGWASFISTPRGKNWFWKLLQTARRNPSMWHSSHYTSADLQHIGVEVLQHERQEMDDSTYRQEYDCDFSAANLGAILGRWMETADKQGRVTDAIEDVREDDEIHVSSDIGRRDKAAFWWWRPCLGGAELVDYDEGSGMDAEEWCERLRASHPRATVFWLPHDAKVKTFQSRKSVVETFLEAEIADEVRIVPLTKKHDQINAGRRMLPHVRMHATRCALGIEALWEYHFHWDDEQKIFSSEPEHDWSSHAADAFMYGAQVLQDFVPAKPALKLPMTSPLHETFTLDGLWSTVGPQRSRRV